MLTLTKNAASVVETIVNQPEVPEGAVVRISSAPVEVETEEAAGESELHFTLEPEPEEGDVVVEGMRLSLEPRTLALLDDKILDAEVNGDSVQFALYTQPPGAASRNGSAPGS